MLCKKKVLQETLLCVDWQRYAKRFQDVQDSGLSFFQMSVSGERGNWKEPSKYLET